MDLPSCRIFLVLLAGIVCIGKVMPMTLSKNDEHQSAENRLVDSETYKELPSSIEFACPLPDSFCIPRTRCAFKSIAYDREGLRFLQGSDQFEDRYGCGAFKPTETFVCCHTTDMLGVESSWTPTTVQWFFSSSSDQTHEGRSSTLSLVPRLSLWPEKNTEFQEHVKDDKSNLEKVQQVSDAIQKKETVNNGEKAQTLDEVPQMGGGAYTDPSAPMFNPAVNQAQKMLNYWAINPTTGLMDQPSSFPPVSSNHNWYHANPMPAQPITSRWLSPRSDWVEMILIYPDGSVQHTIREHRTVNFPPTTERPTTSSTTEVPHSRNRDTTQPLTQQVQNNQEPQSDERSARGRRAVVTQSFKLEAARGGMWTGNLTSNSEVHSRAFVPPPKAIWGMPGSGDVPLRPMPAAFNVNGERCGMSSSSGINARILSGTKNGAEFEAETNLAEFPWHVAVINGNTGNYLCGGAIISGRFIVTVAHCVRRYQSTLLFVRVGDWDLSGTGEMFPSYDVEVLKVLVHEDYNAGNMQNDIALLQLKYPLDFVSMPHIGTVCLPPLISETMFTDCIVTGWGQQVASADGKGDVSTFSRTLRKTTLNLVTPQYCERALRPYLGQFYQLPIKGFVCAYDQSGKDSCFGDGGGALACIVDSPKYGKSQHYVAVGLVSWGVGCGIPGVPGVYTNIMHYRDWIHSKVMPVDPFKLDNSEETVASTQNRHPAIMIRSGHPIEDENSEILRVKEDKEPVAIDFIDLAFN